MAKKSIQELRDFVVKQMPSNSVLLVKPFRTFFDYILDYLADVSSLVDLNKFMFKVFGTTNIDNVNIGRLFDDGSFQGETIIEYLFYLSSKVISNIRKIIKIGDIVTDESKVYLRLHEDGYNEIVIGGIIYQDIQEREFNYIPVTFGIKILLLYAYISDNYNEGDEIFFLIDGQESIEALEPTLPEGSILVRRIIVTLEGQQIIDENTDYKILAEDIWRNYNIPTNNDYRIIMATSQSSSFNITRSNTVSNISITHISSKHQLVFWPGKKWFIRNSTDLPINLNRSDTVIPVDPNYYRTFLQNYIIPPGKTVIISLIGDFIELLDIGSSGSSGGGEWDFI